MRQAGAETGRGGCPKKKVKKGSSGTVEVHGIHTICTIVGPKCGWAGDDLERPGDGAEGLFCVGFLAMEESRRRRRNKQEAPAGASTSTEDICALGALHHCCGCLKCPHLGAYTAQEPSDPHEWPWVFNFNFYFFILGQDRLWGAGRRPWFSQALQHPRNCTSPAQLSRGFRQDNRCARSGTRCFGSSFV